MIGIVADDFTGANDIGIMFALNSYRTYVYSIFDDPRILAEDADVMILNTNSRLDGPILAYEKVRTATRTLKELGCTTFHKKTCSVFRGNIGAEFDAMLDELGEEFCAVVLGFPRNGRVTRGGIHYVHGKQLEESAFKDDPIHPMRESNLVAILQKQTKRKVGLIDHNVISRGIGPTKAAIDEMKGEYQYAIFDVLSQEALSTIAGAVKDEAVLAGSSAIGEELPKWLPGKGRGNSFDHSGLANPDSGTLIIAGSVTPQTRQQVEFARIKGIRTLMLRAADLFDREEGEEAIARFCGSACEEIFSGKDILIHSENRVEQVAASRRAGLELGLDEREVGRLISGALSRITAGVVAKAGLSRLIVLGGETSGVICEGLGIVGNLVLKEISPGVPSVLTIGRTKLLMAPKSGSFGAEDFIISANEHLKGIQSSF